VITKRFFLIAGGTVTGLGVVLSITPPQFGTATGLALGTTTTTPPVASSASTPPTPPTTPTTPTPAPAPTATKTKTPFTGATTTPKARPKSRPKSTPKARPKSTPKATPKSTPTPVQTPPASGVSGTFTGATASTIYGPVQVQITLTGGKITNAVALAYPTRDFRSQQINQQAIPFLIQETLAAQSANIQGVSGASYTSQGWFTSLTSALAKAGM
jgi:uncharacterized protein with FMN-binding domain